MLTSAVLTSWRCELRRCLWGDLGTVECDRGGALTDGGGLTDRTVDETCGVRAGGSLADTRALVQPATVMSAVTTTTNGLQWANGVCTDQ